MFNGSDRPEQIQALLLRAQQLAQAGRPDEAIEALRHGVGWLRSSSANAEDRSLELAMLMMMGGLHMSMGKVFEAEGSLREALDRSRELREPEGEHVAMVTLGSLLLRRGEPEEARELLTHSLELAHRLGDPEAEFRSLLGLGLSLRFRGEYLQARERLEQAASLAREHGQAAEEAQALTHLGTLLHYLGDSRAAVATQERALELLRRAGDEGVLADVPSEMGRASLAAGDEARAEQLLGEALERAREAGDLILQGHALANLAQVALVRGDLPRALRCYQESLAIKEKSGDVAGTSLSLGSMSSVLVALGSHREALAAAERAVELSRRVGGEEDVGMSLTVLGNVRYRCGDLAGAESALRESLERLEPLRRKLGAADDWQISISDRHYAVYRILQEVLAAQGQAGAALEVSERGRAQALALRMSGKIESPAAPRLDDLKRIAREQRATLIEYTVIPDLSGSPILLIWVLGPDGEVAVRRKEIDLAASPLRGELWQEPQEPTRDLDGSGYWSKSGSWHTGYRMLIEPIEDLLPAGRGDRLVIIPQDSFFFAPWAALEDAQGVPLVERFTLSFSPSIQILDLTRRRAAELSGRAGEPLVIGDPAFAAKTGLPRLEGAEEEARAIAELLGTRPLLGAEATKEAVLRRMPRSRLLHFATHGVLEDVDGTEIPGAIALAPSRPGDDGLLSSAEIMRLDLEAELAVLSACQTGRGRESTDSVIGLSRAFLLAGVPSLILSLWPVPDAPTACLMKELYRALERGSHRAQALREAMLATRELYPDPMNWAGFVLLGEAV